MDKETIKLLLESYRPQNAEDPIFAEALRQVAEDPELAAWFADLQLYDGVMQAKFEELVVPPDVKSHILLGYRASQSVSAARGRNWMAWTAGIAALILVSLVSWHFIVPAKPPMDTLQLQAISFSEKMPALQFVCFDANAVAQWVNRQPGSQEVGLTLPNLDRSLSMSVIGSSIVDWNGKPVVMVCLQNGKSMAMLYILKADESHPVPEGKTEKVHNGWTVQTTRSNGQIRLLAARGGRENLNFQFHFSRPSNNQFLDLDSPLQWRAGTDAPFRGPSRPNGSGRNRDRKNSVRKSAVAHSRRIAP